MYPGIRFGIQVRCAFGKRSQFGFRDRCGCVVDQADPGRCPASVFLFDQGAGRSAGRMVALGEISHSAAPADTGIQSVSE